MRLRHDLRYDAPPTEVLAMLHDTDYWEKVGVATEARSCSATTAADGDTVTVVVDQQQEVAGVPAFAKKIVGDSTRAIKTMVWTGHAATMEVETPGKPTHLGGSATVEPDGTGSVLRYDLEVKAGVPLVGGKLEKLVGDLTAEGFDTEGRVGAAWLAGDR